MNKIILIFFCLLYITTQGYGQNQLDLNDLEKGLNRLEGPEKLQRLNLLAAGHYEENNLTRSTRFGRQAVELGEELYDLDSEIPDPGSVVMISVYNNYGKVLYDRGRLEESKLSFEKAQELSVALNYFQNAQITSSYLASIDSAGNTVEKEGFFTRTFKGIKVGEFLKESGKSATASLELEKGTNKEKSGNYDEAIGHYNTALALYEEMEKEDQAFKVRSKIANIKSIMSLATKIEREDSIFESTINKPITRKELENFELPGEFEERLDLQPNELFKISEQYAEQNDFESALEFQRLAQQLQEKNRLDSLNYQMESQKNRAALDEYEKQKVIDDIEMQVMIDQSEQQEKIKNLLIIIASVILIGVIVTSILYFSKKKQHSLLTQAYIDLDESRSDLENAQKRISKLLQQQVSGDIASQLIKGKEQTMKKFVCVMFLDIRDFTPKAEKMKPEELIEYQNAIFGFMIDIIIKHNGNINQFIGDGFMCTFGAPTSHGNDCENAYKASIEIIEELKRRNKSGKIPITEVGIGLHAGNVVTGNVGTEQRMQYSVTGSTVIIAARVEQLNKTYKSQLIITEEVCNELPSSLINKSEEMEEVKVKGRTEPLKILQVA